jgi:hypothetical protein
VNLESSSIEILDQLHWSLNKEKDCLRDCKVEKGGGLFYQVVKARYLDCCESWEAYESLGADLFGKPSNTLEPSLWIHSTG